MPDEINHAILFVDDEPSILKSLQRLFRTHGYRIKTANSGAEGLDAIRSSEVPISLIVSDQRMPEMNGSQFLERAKELAPEAARFLLTGYSDLDAVIDAVNKGEIHRYLTKPWNDEELLLSVRQAVEHYRLIAENRRLSELTQRQNRELGEMNRHLEDKVSERTVEIQRKNTELENLYRRLEQNFMDTIRLMSSLVESLNPRLGRLMHDVAQLAKEVAGDFDLPDDEINQIEIAALIHDVGLLGLPEKIWQKDEKDLSDNEIRQYHNHPVMASICLEPIDKLSRVMEIVLHHHEHVDGSGFPSGMRENEIPIGSRILLAVSDCCRILHLGKAGRSQALGLAKQHFGHLNAAFLKMDSNQIAFETAKRLLLLYAKRRYDMTVVTTLIARLEERRDASAGVPRKGESIQAVELDLLKEGMTLAVPLKIKGSELLVLGKGSRLNPSSMATIRKMQANHLLEDKVWIALPRPTAHGDE